MLSPWPQPGLPGEPSAQAPGTCGSWGWEHRVGIGRQIIYVSRIYESFSVQIAVLDFSSIGKLLWLLELEQKSPVIAVTSAWGVLLGPCYFFSTPLGSFLFFIWLNKRILIIHSLHGVGAVREWGRTMLLSCVEHVLVCVCAVGFDTFRQSRDQCLTHFSPIWTSGGFFVSHLPLGEGWYGCHDVTLQKTLPTAPKASGHAFPAPFSKDASHFLLE